jgi:hypothetical protein
MCSEGLTCFSFMHKIYFCLLLNAQIGYHIEATQDVDAEACFEGKRLYIRGAEKHAEYTCTQLILLRWYRWKWTEYLARMSESRIQMFVSIAYEIWPFVWRDYILIAHETRTIGFSSKLFFMKLKYHFSRPIECIRRSQCPRRLMHIATVGSNPTRAMHMRVFSFMLMCVGTGFVASRSPFKESYQMSSIKQYFETRKRGDLAALVCNCFSTFSI